MSFSVPFQFDFSDRAFREWLVGALRQERVLEPDPSGQGVVEQGSILKAAKDSFLGDQPLSLFQKQYLLHQLRFRQLLLDERGNVRALRERRKGGFVERPIEEIGEDRVAKLASKVEDFFRHLKRGAFVDMGTDERGLRELLRGVDPREMALFKDLVSRHSLAEGKGLDELLEEELSSRELGEIHRIVQTAEVDERAWLIRGYGSLDNRLNRERARLKEHQGRHPFDRAGLSRREEEVRAGYLRRLTPLLDHEAFVGLTENDLKGAEIGLLAALVAGARALETEERVREIARAHDVGDGGVVNRALEWMRDDQDQSAHGQTLAKFKGELAALLSEIRSKRDSYDLRAFHRAMGEVFREAEIFVEQEREGVAELERNVEACVSGAKMVATAAASIVAGTAMAGATALFGLPLLVGGAAGTLVGLGLNLGEARMRGKSIGGHFWEMLHDSATEGFSSALSLGIGALAAKGGAKLMQWGVRAAAEGKRGWVPGAAISLGGSRIAQQIAMNEAIGFANALLRGDYEGYGISDVIVSGVSGVVGGGLIDRHLRGGLNLAAEMAREGGENLAEVGIESGNLTVADGIGAAAGALSEFGGSVGSRIAAGRGARENASARPVEARHRALASSPEVVDLALSLGGVPAEARGALVRALAESEARGGRIAVEDRAMRKDHPLPPPPSSAAPVEMRADAGALFSPTGSGISQPSSPSQRRSVLIEAASSRPSPSPERVEKLQRRLAAERATEKGPSSKTLLFLGLALKDIGRVSEAIEVLEEAACLAPAELRILGTLGTLLRKTGRAVEAVAVLRKAVELKCEGTSFSWCELGIALKKTGAQAADVEAAFLESLRLDPTQSRTWCEFGIILRELGRMRESAEALRKAIGIEGNTNPRSLCELGVTLRIAGEVEESLRDLRRAIVLERARDNEKARTWCELGIALRTGGESLEAVRALKRAIELQGDHARTWCELGVALRALGRHAESEEALRRALSLEKGRGLHTRCELAETLREMVRLAEAEEILRDVIKEEGERLPQSWIWLGLLLRDKGDLVGAEGAYRKATLLDEGKRVDSWSGLGAVLVLRGKLSEAEEVIARALGCDGAIPDRILHSYSIALKKTGRAAEAMAVLQRLSAMLKSEGGRPPYGLCITLLEEGKVDEAVKAFQAATTAGGAGWNRVANPLCELGVKFRDAGKLDESERALRKAVEFRPGNSRFHCELGVTLRRLKRFQESEETLRRAIALGGEATTRLWCELGITLRIEGKHEESEAALRKAIGLEDGTKGSASRYWCELGITLGEAVGRLAEAEAAVRRAIALEGEGEPRSWCSLGITLRRMGDLQGSEEALQRATAQRGGRGAHAWRELGITLRQRGEHERSVAALRRASELEEGKEAVTWHELGIAARELGDLDGSADAFRKALALAGSSQVRYVLPPREIWGELGFTLKAAGQGARAAAAFQRAIDLGGDGNHSYWREFGAALRSAGNLAESEKVLHRAIELGGDSSAGAWCELGITLRHAGRRAESEAALRRAIEMGRGDFSRAFCELGVTLREEGRLQESEAAIREAIRIEEGGVVRHWTELGITLKEMGDWDGALEAFQRGVAIEERGASRPWCEFGVALREVGDLAGSERALSEAVRRGGEGEERNWCELGITLRALGRVAESEEALKRAIALSPESGRYWCELGITQMLLGRRQQAIASLERGTTINRRHSQLFPRVEIMLAYLYLGAGKVEKALRQIAAFQEEVAAARADFPAARVPLLIARLMRGEFGEARSLASEISSKLPVREDSLRDLLDLAMTGAAAPASSHPPGVALLCQRAVREQLHALGSFRSRRERRGEEWEGVGEDPPRG